MFTIIAFAIIVVCTVLGCIIGDRNDSAILGGILGLLLGPFGILIACFVTAAKPTQETATDSFPGFGEDKPRSSDELWEANQTTLSDARHEACEQRRRQEQRDLEAYDVAVIAFDRKADRLHRQEWIDANASLIIFATAIIIIGTIIVVAVL